MSAMDPFFDELDLNEPDYRCKHGTFIGNPYGADYMCGRCEMGDDEDEEEVLEGPCTDSGGNRVWNGHRYHDIMVMATSSCPWCGWVKR